MAFCNFNAELYTLQDAEYIRKTGYFRDSICLGSIIWDSNQARYRELLKNIEQ